MLAATREGGFRSVAQLDCTLLGRWVALIAAEVPACETALFLGCLSPHASL